jgi:hypothetical protein
MSSLGRKLKTTNVKVQSELEGSVVSPSASVRAATKQPPWRGAARPRNFVREEGDTCAIPDLAGAAAPARPNVDPPLRARPGSPGSPARRRSYGSAK